MLPEVGATELLVIAAIALIVVGPKDLPVMLRKLGQFLARMRAMASDFRASFDEMARQSELDELRREVEAIRAAHRDPLTYMAGDAAYDPEAAQVFTDIHEGLTASPIARAPVIEGPPEAVAEPGPAPAPNPKRVAAKKPAAAKAPAKKTAAAPKKPRSRKTPETPA